MDKKTKIKVIFLSVFVFLLVGGVITLAIINMKKNEFFLTTIPKSYCYVLDNSSEKELEAYVYVSSKDSFVTDISKCNNAYIQSRNRMDKLKLNLKTFSSKGEL